MGLQPARLKQENNVSLMYMPRFCKVVTSVVKDSFMSAECICIDFVRLLHPLLHKSLLGYECICIDFVRLLHPRNWCEHSPGMYMHRFCKVVTSAGPRGSHFVRLVYQGL